MSITPGGRERRLTVGWVVVGVAALAVGMGLLIPPIRTAREAGRRTTWQNNMRMISLALQGYVNAHGSLPPAYVADASGRPLYSWRVLIMPFLMSHPFISDFRRDEPWDSPHNIKLIGPLSELFRCPSHNHSGASEPCTSYFALRGPGSAFSGPVPVPFDRISDPPGQTILFVESDQGDVPWTAPVDIDAATGRLTWATPGDPAGPISPHMSGINVALADGSVHLISNTEFKRLMRPLSTIAGSETVKIGEW